jgi:hypothetical protein
MTSGAGVGGIAAALVWTGAGVNFAACSDIMATSFGISAMLRPISLERPTMISYRRR